MQKNPKKQKPPKPTQKPMLNLEVALVGLCHEYSSGVAGPRGTHEEHKCGLAEAEEFRPKRPPHH